jgi:GAF domain-containing protein
MREARMDLDALVSRIGNGNLEGALRAATKEICEAFKADRFTVYRANGDGTHLLSIVQSGIESFGTVKVRIDSGRSVAGHVGATKKLVNIRDAYDDAELAPLNMAHKMFKAVDERTGFRTTQVLAAPIVSSDGKLLGVIELLNRADGRRFPSSCETELKDLCAALAPAFSKQTATAD